MSDVGELTRAWRLPAGAISYLMGRAFNCQYRLVLEASAARAPRARWDFLLAAAAGRKVLHMGCLDHEPLIHQKIAAGTWLHEALRRVSASCVGVDIDTDVIATLRARYGAADIHAHNVMEGSLPHDVVKSVDVVLLPDVLEHIPAPVEFLAALRRSFSMPAPRLVLTVPSATTLDGTVRAMRASEWVNSDHYAAYTPYTLARVLVRAGWVPQDLFFLDYSLPPRATGVRTFVRGYMLRRFPLLRDTIAVVCS